MIELEQVDPHLTRLVAALKALAEPNRLRAVAAIARNLEPNATPPPDAQPV